MDALAAIDQAAIDQATTRWAASSVAPSTIYRRFSALRSFARYLAHHKSCGYRVLVIWECSSRRPERAAEQIADFFKTLG